jgi:hypothetical protein
VPFRIYSPPTETVDSVAAAGGAALPSRVTFGDKWRLFHGRYLALGAARKGIDY